MRTIRRSNRRAILLVPLFSQHFMSMSDQHLNFVIKMEVPYTLNSEYSLPVTCTEPTGCFPYEKNGLYSEGKNVREDLLSLITMEERPSTEHGRQRRTAVLDYRCLVRSSVTHESPFHSCCHANYNNAHAAEIKRFRPNACPDK